jgi:hypothetical protein
VNIETNNNTTNTTAEVTSHTNFTNAPQQPITKWFSKSPNTTNHVENYTNQSKTTSTTTIKSGLQLLNKPTAANDKRQNSNIHISRMEILMPTKQKISNIKSTLTSLTNQSNTTTEDIPTPSHTKTTLYDDNTQETNESYYESNTTFINNTDIINDNTTQEMEITTNDNDIIDKYADQLELLTTEYINQLPHDDKISLKLLLAEESHVFQEEMPFTLVTGKSKSKISTTKTTTDMETINHTAYNTQITPTSPNSDRKQAALNNPYVFGSARYPTNSRNNTPIKNNMSNTQEREQHNSRGRGGGRSPIHTGRGPPPAPRLKQPPKQQPTDNNNPTPNTSSNNNNNEQKQSNTHNQQNTNISKNMSNNNSTIENKHIFCIYINVRKQHQSDHMNKEAIIEHILQSFQIANKSVQLLSTPSISHTRLVTQTLYQEPSNTLIQHHSRFTSHLEVSPKNIVSGNIWLTSDEHYHILKKSQLFKRNLYKKILHIHDIQQIKYKIAN